jgi:D-sedoheptulose 7-phosphate isomerase
MLEARVQQQFFEAADLFNQGAQSLARPLAQAAQAVLSCITGGGKLLVAGADEGAALAAVLVAALTGRFERDRPPMAALALTDAPPLNVHAQLRALGQPGDLLLLIDPSGASRVLREAARVAHEAEVSVIVCAGADTIGWREVLVDTDMLLAVPHERAARVAEVHLLLLHGLCDAVDLQLMGEMDPT